MSEKARNASTVFISSTNVDLEAYRKEAAIAAHGAGLLADLQAPVQWGSIDPCALKTGIRALIKRRLRGRTWNKKSRNAWAVNRNNRESRYQGLS